MLQAKIIFELKPRDFTKSDEWPDKCFFERVVVRAGNEQEARGAVDDMLRKMLDLDTDYIAHNDNTNILTPWGDNVMTICNAINNSGYNSEGKTEILFPDDLKNGGGGNSC